MRLVMTLLVRNEADILASNIEFHRAQGVDFFIVTDNGSTDGALDILRDCERDGGLQLILENDDNFAQSHWVTRMARIAATEHGADWVINCDTDEFWWPEQGSLKTRLAQVPHQDGIVVAHRSNFLPSANEELPIFERMTIREKKSFNSLGKPLPPKVCHRASPAVQVAMGNHDVEDPNLVGVHPSQPIEIFHFPLRTYSQFENKVRLGGAALERNTYLPKNIGDNWRHLFQIYLKGGLPDYYASQVLCADSVERGVANGSLMRDDRLLKYLRDQRLGQKAN